MPSRKVADCAHEELKKARNTTGLAANDFEVRRSAERHLAGFFTAFMPAGRAGAGG